MNQHLINFEQVKWVSAAEGVRFKVYENGRQRIRLIEFKEGFVEPDWCLAGHAGYVLEGTFSTEYNGYVEHYHQGDIIFIPKGEADKHKAVLGKGERVLFLVFEVME